MGKEIVYCGGCGTGLREQDFSAGKARDVEGRPYCTACKPGASAPPGSGTPKRGTGRIPRASPPQTTRRAARSESGNRRLWLLLGAAIGAFVLLALILAAFSVGRSRPGAPPPPTESR
jgi:hypothetical protein